MPTALDERALLATIKTTVEDVRWTDGGARCFGEGGMSVVVSPMPPGKLFNFRRTPIAQIIPQSQRYDEDSPGLRYAQFAVRLYVIDRRDDAGEASIMGAADEQGLMQLSRRVDLSIQLLTRSTVPIVSRGVSSGAVQLEDGTNVVYREHTYEAVVAVEVE